MHAQDKPGIFHMSFAIALGCCFLLGEKIVNFGKLLRKEEDCLFPETCEGESGMV